MDNAEFAGNPELKNVLSGFINSYAQRDTSVDFQSWLADRLRQEMPDMAAEASERLAGEIVAAIADYDKTLQELNDSVEMGSPRRSGSMNNWGRSAPICRWKQRVRPSSVWKQN